MLARLAVVTSLVALASPPVASAALPATKKGTEIVLGRSIGAVKIGQTKARAKKAWGGAGMCPAGSLVTCVFADAKRSASGFGQFGIEGGKVATIQLSLGSNASTKRPDLNTSLRRFKTKKGVRLGSSLASLLKAYPKNTKFKAFDGTISDVKVAGPGRGFTVFTIRFGVVTSLRVDDGDARS